MKTSDLIAALAADAGTQPKRITPALAAAFGLAALGACVVFLIVLGPRHDLAAALGTFRFPWKFVLTTSFAAAATLLALRLARPGADLRAGKVALVAAIALLAGSVAAELLVVPAADWGARLVGRNWLLCLVNVPLLSIAPLAAMLFALRRGAPSSPSALGAAAGLLAGAIGATFYAAHCFDDSPLFVATWYTLGVGLVTLAGAAIGARLLKW